MAYATVSDVQNILANNNLGVSGGTVVDDTQLSAMIDFATGVINTYLDIDSDVTESRYLTRLGLICIQMVRMLIAQARIGKNTNDPTQSVNVNLQLLSKLDPEDIRFLNMLRDRLRSNPAYLFNTQTGNRVI